jgi:copper oxidase (laccase) domain-containing protein
MAKNIKFFFSNRHHGNMSFSHGERIEVFFNRLDVATSHNFSLFSTKNKKVVPHGFAPKLDHGEDILMIRHEEKSTYDGIGIAFRGNISFDAVITNAKNFPLILPNADCYPVLLHDQKESVMAIVHSGRDGTLKNIAGKTLEKMREEFGCYPEETVAYVFPGICSRCYLLKYLDAKVPADLERFIKETGNNLISLDLRGMIIRQLLRADVQRVRFPEGQHECTCHTLSGNGGPLYFSSYGNFHSCRWPGHKESGNNALFAELTEG